MPQRFCKNWLAEYLNWTLHRSEAKESFVLWSGISTIASVLKRKVTIPKSLLGSWSIYPYLYIVFVAPPGKARKTTTANYTEGLLKRVPNIEIAPSAITQQALHDTLTKTEDGAITIISGELANLIGPSGELMYEYLTGVFDGKDEFTYKTLGRGKQEVIKPCINLFAATIPSYISEMPVAIVEGGFASRVIFVYEEEVRQRRLFYDDILDVRALEQLEIKLVADLAVISEMKGEFVFENKETKDHIEKWYQSTADNFPLSDPRTHGYFERKPAHVLKVTMCVRASYSNDPVLTIRDFNKALEIVEDTEKNLPKVFRGVGKNPHVGIMEQMVEYVQTRKVVTSQELKRRFSASAPPSLLDDFIEANLDMGYFMKGFRGMKKSDSVYYIMENGKPPTGIFEAGKEM